MRNLYRVCARLNRDSDFRELAKSWPVWESATHQPPLVDDKVRFRYDGDYGSERIRRSRSRHVIPMIAGYFVTIGPGDSLHLHYGFSCVWHIHEAMAQHYGYFDTSGNEIAENEMTCDVCGADCFEESYLFNDEQDICPEVLQGRPAGRGGVHRRRVPARGQGGEAAAAKAPGAREHRLGRRLRQEAEGEGW